MKTILRLNKPRVIPGDTLTKQKGISLIELLLVIALAGVMATWGTQSWHHYRQRERLADSARQLLAFLTHLQAKANRNNSSVLLWVEPGQQGCLGSGDKPVTPCALLENSVFTPPYTDVAIAISLKKEIGFFGTRNTAQAGNIMLNNSAGRIRLILSSRGRMRLCSEEQSISGIHLCKK
ncbi:prepilin peptidase-dependent protein [Yersinia hibernica]|uniref:Prepilin peptidase-dependent protein n=1 Tax=Yersinia hibernica TaxID=2339259 RepID=A0ABX5R3S7_9GAMM|nr:prepilin peptidase-dependent protein [Yersinia hibernica]QAX80153.1 prepilin peptidase-dependent protein [Yersinia hibernica]